MNNYERITFWTKGTRIACRLLRGSIISRHSVNKTAALVAAAKNSVFSSRRRAPRPLRKRGGRSLRSCEKKQSCWQRNQRRAKKDGKRTAPKGAPQPNQRSRKERSAGGRAPKISSAPPPCGRPEQPQAAAAAQRARRGSPTGRQADQRKAQPPASRRQNKAATGRKGAERRRENGARGSRRPPPPRAQEPKAEGARTPRSEPQPRRARGRGQERRGARERQGDKRSKAQQPERRTREHRSDGGARASGGKRRRRKRKRGQPSFALLPEAPYFVHRLWRVNVARKPPPLYGGGIACGTPQYESEHRTSKQRRDGNVGLLLQESAAPSKQRRAAKKCRRESPYGSLTAT